MNMNFNDAGTQFESGGDFELIPNDTIVDVVMTVRPGHVGDGGWLTQGKPTLKSISGWHWLDCEFVIIGGELDKRKFWQLFMVVNPQPAEGYAESAEKTANITRSNFRAMLESARGIRPDDETPAGQQARQIDNYSDLNGLQFKVKMGVEKGTDGYNDKNKIKCIITPDMEGYGAAPVQAPAGMQTVGQAADAVVAQATAAQASNVPAWATK
jgi:hypothetical protein